MNVLIKYCSQFRTRRLSAHEQKSNKQKNLREKIFSLLFFASLILSSIPAISQSTEYIYDGNGNMKEDMNKNIASIHYNLLNLPDTIVFDDGRTIVYSYTALGQKVSQHVFASGGGLLQTQDYMNAFYYRNDTLREIQHSEGRLVASVANPASSWEYQYQMTDHLGNVRTTITSAADTIEYFASMETESAELEQTIFKGLEKNRMNFLTANHTAKGNEVVRVTSEKESEVVAMNLPVERGDVIYIQVHAYHEGDATRKENNQISNLPKLVLPMVMGALNGVSITAEGSNGLLSSTNAAGNLLVQEADRKKPKAHLNYQVFDREYKAIDAGFVGVTEESSFSREFLKLGPINIQRSGYLYVYLSNSSEENIPVYFDDLQITHVPTPIIQEDSYDPFGMTLVEQHAEGFGVEHNHHLFNGKELQQAFDLNWYDYGARMYDAPLGRWHVPDLLAEKFHSLSVYNYALNNPTSLMDPDGRDIVFYQSGTDKARHDKLMTAVTWLRNTDEGRKILSTAENNKNISVYITGKDVIGDGTTGGMTTGPLAVQKLYGTIAKGETSLKLGKFSGASSSEFNVFVGLDIISDIRENREVYFIVIDVEKFGSIPTANMIGHELEAHVNINQRIKDSFKNGKIDVTQNGKKISLSSEDAEHLMFGSPSMSPDGSVNLMNNGESAERLQEQLIELLFNKITQPITYQHLWKK